MDLTLVLKQAQTTNPRFLRDVEEAAIKNYSQGYTKGIEMAWITAFVDALAREGFKIERQTSDEREARLKLLTSVGAPILAWPVKK
jgi:hypothetical protein